MYKPDFRKEEIKLCVLRSLCISVFLLIAFLMIHSVDSGIWITSLGATTFIAFAFPRAESVKTRVLLGGTVSACLWGSIISIIGNAFDEPYIVLILLCMASVFMTSLFMTVFDLEHPPSAALAIALVLSTEPLKMAGITIVCVIVLCIIKMPLARLVLNEPSKGRKEADVESK